jgi:hypothetical protein
MNDGSSEYRSWANVNKVKKESIPVIDEQKVDVILQVDKKGEGFKLFDR